MTLRNRHQLRVIIEPLRSPIFPVIHIRSLTNEHEIQAAFRGKLSRPLDRHAGCDRLSIPRNDFVVSRMVQESPNDRGNNSNQAGDAQDRDPASRTRSLNIHFENIVVARAVQWSSSQSSNAGASTLHRHVACHEFGIRTNAAFNTHVEGSSVFVQPGGSVACKNPCTTSRWRALPIGWQVNIVMRRPGP